MFVISVTGDHTMMNPYGKYAEDKVLKLSKHRLCHFDCKINVKQTEPSNVCFRVYSAEDIKSHPCKCNLPFQDQRNDWKTSGDLENAQPKNRVTSLVRRTVLHKLGYSEERLPASTSKKDSGTVSPKKTGKKRVHFSETKDDMTPQCSYPTEQRGEWKRKQKANKEAGLGSPKET